MKQFKLGIATDKAEIDAALRANPINEYSPRILGYPTTRVLLAYESDEKHYMPVQQVLMIESLSANIPPNALRDLVKGAELYAASHGIKELYFLDGAGGVAEFATHRGFEEVPYKVFRMVL